MGCQKTEDIKETEEISQEVVEETDEYEIIARENFLLKEELRSLQNEILFYEQYVMRESARHFMEWSDGPTFSETTQGTEYSEENAPYTVTFPVPFDESKVEVIIEPVAEGEKESLILLMEEENESLRSSIEKLTTQAEAYRKIYGIGEDVVLFEQPTAEENPNVIFD